MKTLSCIGPQTKSAVTEEIDRSSLSQAEKTELNQFLKNFPTCGVGIPVELQDIPTEKKGERVHREKGERPKRPPSAYNLFVKECFKDPEVKRLGTAPKKMKACGSKWREKKGK